MRGTRVVNLRREPYDVYIGRAGRGHDGYHAKPVRVGGETEREHSPASPLTGPRRRSRERASLNLLDGSAGAG